MKSLALNNGIQAALVLMLVMGFGRFAYTALYPHMVSDAVMTVSQGSVIASLNYLGYLVGALLAVRIRVQRSHLAVLLALAGTGICLGLMAVLSSASVLAVGLAVVRFLAGVFSAIGIVAVSLWLLAKQKHTHLTPLMYAGVGLGIAVSSELVVLGVAIHQPSSVMWGGLAIVSLVVSLMVVPALFGQSTSNVSKASSLAVAPRLTPNALIALYGLAGFGYIITATYLPLLVELADIDINIGHIWAVFGLSAVPSCFIWHRVHERFGTRVALTLNLSTQVIGVLLPVMIPHTLGYGLSALLVGGSFMGTVTIVMPVAQALNAKHQDKNLIALATFAYSLGQVIAPLIAGGLYEFTQSFAPAVMLAALGLGVGTVIAHQKA